MNETFEAKKKALTESLNALSPKEEAKWFGTMKWSNIAKWIVFALFV
jgi:hypothetical protein